MEAERAGRSRLLRRLEEPLSKHWSILILLVETCAVMRSACQAKILRTRLIAGGTLCVTGWHAFSASGLDFQLSISAMTMLPATLDSRERMRIVGSKSMCLSSIAKLQKSGRSLLFTSIWKAHTEEKQRIKALQSLN